MNRVGQFYLTKEKSKQFLKGTVVRFGDQGRIRNPGTHLRLNLSAVSSSDLTEIGRVRHLIYALEVDLSNRLFDVPHMADVVGLMPGVISLTLKKAELLTSMEFIKLFPALHELTLTHLPDLDLQPLAGCSFLRVLKIPDSKISDENLAKYCRLNSFLQALHLPRVPTRLSFISQRETPRLRELNIQGRTIHTASFTPLFQLPSLETLEVSKTDIKFSHIRQIRSLQRLIVHADGTREKRNEIAKLREVFPHIVIEEIHKRRRTKNHQYRGYLEYDTRSYGFDPYDDWFVFDWLGLL